MKEGKKNKQAEEWMKHHIYLPSFELAWPAEEAESDSVNEEL